MEDAGQRDAGPREDVVVVDGGRVACTSDEECNDGVGCTIDSCGLDGECRNAATPSICDDGVYCNGVERCDPRLGCLPPSVRETCNDDDVCTLDRCDEETRGCLHFPRDLDEDGDPDWFCGGGGDCDDRNPAVSSLVNEVCDDLVDNDCDGIVDEPACGRPRYDLCEDPLDVSSGGFYTLNTGGAERDYPLSCGDTRDRDLVATFTLTEPRSVTIEGSADFFSVRLSLRTTCESGASEIVCKSGFPGSIRRRSLPAGTYFVIVGASTAGEIGLNVRFGAPIDAEPNDTCASPTDVSAGGTFTASFIEIADDVSTSCGFGGAPDLVYTFTTEEERDVRVTAQSSGGQSLNWAVQTTCGGAPDLRCVYGAPATGLIHQLPAGTYFLVVEGPTYVDVSYTLMVDFLPPTPIPAGDNCDEPLPLTLGVTTTGTFIDKQDDHDVSCGFRYRDVVHSFTIDAISDVTIELDGGIFANMSLRTVCANSATQLACPSGDPARARLRNLAAGTYYVIAESSSGSGYTLRVDATPPTVPVDVAGNDTCSTAYVMPEAGGLFRGNTTLLVDNYRAPCGGAGANDAVFELTLTAPRRASIATTGSLMDTVLYVYRGACTAGSELYCDDDGGGGGASLISRVLDAGTWYIVVDGWTTGVVGQYLLEVMLTDP